MPYCDNKEVIFLHVPKTGGTTIKRILDIHLLHDSNPAVSPSPQHLTCDRLRERLGIEKYSAYYKFAFVRNPWARILSSYFWRQTLPKKRTILPFGAFIENARRLVRNEQYYDQEFGDHFIPQVEYTSDVNDVFKFEDFENSIKIIAAKLNTPLAKIPPKKPKHYDQYWEYFDNQTREIIAEIYSDDIREFGYKFKT